MYRKNARRLIIHANKIFKNHHNHRKQWIGLYRVRIVALCIAIYLFATWKIIKIIFLLLIRFFIVSCCIYYALHNHIFFFFIIFIVFFIVFYSFFFSFFFPLTIVQKKNNFSTLITLRIFCLWCDVLRAWIELTLIIRRKCEEEPLLEQN